MSLGFIADRQRGDASCLGRSVAPQHKPLSSSVCHFLRCHRCGIVSPSCLSLPHHAPSFQTPAACRCAQAEGAADAERAPGQFYFSLSFPADVGKAFRSLTPPPPPSSAPLDLFLESNVMIVADFENLEMHLLSLIAELLLHGSKWHVRAFCLPHFGSFGRDASLRQYAI